MSCAVPILENGRFHPYISYPINGRYPTRPSLEQNKFAVVCFDGYTLIGIDRIYCLAPGDWTSLNFTCESKLIYMIFISCLLDEHLTDKG